MCPSRQNNEALEASNRAPSSYPEPSPCPSWTGAEGAGRSQWGRGLQGAAQPHEGSPLAK